jgi:hypothetical protein
VQVSRSNDPNIKLVMTSVKADMEQAAVLLSFCTRIQWQPPSVSWNHDSASWQRVYRFRRPSWGMTRRTGSPAEDPALCRMI